MANNMFKVCLRLQDKMSCFDNHLSVAVEGRHKEIAKCPAVETLLAITCSSIRRGDLHGVRGNVGSVGPPILAGAGERNALLVARKLDEFAELLLSEHLQGSPEELDVLVCLHQTHLIHGVSLQREREQGELRSDLINTKLY